MTMTLHSTKCKKILQICFPISHTLMYYFITFFFECQYNDMMPISISVPQSSISF